MLLLKQLLKSGVVTIVDAYTRPRAYVRPSEHGFLIDHQNLLGDVGVVGNDMRGAMKKHGSKQPYESSGVGAARTATVGSAYQYR